MEVGIEHSTSNKYKGAPVPYRGQTAEPALVTVPFGFDDWQVRKGEGSYREQIAKVPGTRYTVQGTHTHTHAHSIVESLIAHHSLKSRTTNDTAEGITRSSAERTSDGEAWEVALGLQHKFPDRLSVSH